MGLTLMALRAGSNPAKAPEMMSITNAEIAILKSTWGSLKGAPPPPFEVNAILISDSKPTPRESPTNPAIEVNTTDSVIICDMITRGGAPMAR